MCAFIRAVLSVIVLCAASTLVSAQEWPSRPIRFIVSQAAGGTPDLLCRLISERISRKLGQQIVVENKPGGGNVVGAAAAAQAAPDGYTFFFATGAALVTNAYTFKSLPYDPVKSFTPVGMVGKNPFILVVNPSVPAKTLPEFMALVKADPSKISIATDGQRNFSGMLTAWIGKLGGVNLVQVPYAAMPQGVQDTIGGRVQGAIIAIASAAPHLASGSLRALAVSSLQRVPAHGDIPPIADTFSGFDFIGWFVLVAPAGTPAEIVAKMNKELDVALKDPEIVKRMNDVGVYSDGAETPAATAAYNAAQYEAWGKAVKEIGLQAE
jgi:tripartite-type tricarboxylate transporter receptor subunit TctC